MPADLRSLDLAELEAFAGGLGEPRHRAAQLFRWLHGRGAATPAEMTNLPAALRERLAAEHPFATLAVEDDRLAADGTRKLLLAAADGARIETVLIPDEEKLTQCVSSQVGCALGCRFCATGTLGRLRDLPAGEIVDQVYRARAITGRRPTNVVFMGMGEPLLNLDAVVRAVRLLGDELGIGISPRRITVSTAGVAPGIARLGRELPGIGLAVTIAAPTDDVRNELVPIGRKWPLAELLAAVRAFPLPPRRRVTFEYVLLAGVNDADADAVRLAALLRGIRCKVNLLAWNEWPGAPFRRPDEARVLAFQATLQARGLPVYLRQSRGRDVAAACGQLAARRDGAVLRP